MRKTIAWLLMLVILMGACGAVAEGEIMTINDFDDEPVTLITDDDASSGGEGEEEPPVTGIQRGTSLTVGTLTAMNGYFSTDMWGNNTADMDVRAMLHGYETVAFTEQGLSLNTQVVESMHIDTSNPSGPVYVINIARNLLYCDGSPITAADYVFSLLLSGAPEIAALGGTPSTLSHIQGYDAYMRGETNELAGLRLLSEYSFSMLVMPEYLPYFYGLAMIVAKPLPISVIAPGCQIMDDGRGVYIGAMADVDTSKAANLGYTPGDFSAEMLEATMMDLDSGYLSHPSITCGPYRLVSYDRQASEVTFTINEYYKGNHEGITPHIENVIFRSVQEETMLEELADGRIDLMNKINKPETVRAMQALAAEQGNLSQANYLRTGFAYLAFTCDRTPTDSVAVRQAVAKAFDKDAFVADAMQGSALRTYAYYGLGQWMATYTDEGDASAGTEPINVLELLPSFDVPMDTEEAVSLLEADGWTLNAQGEPYLDGIRYRQGAETLEPLMLHMAVTEDSTVAQQIADVLTDTLPAVGIGLEVTEMPFPELLKYYYRQEPGEYDLYFLASNFTYIFDPYYDFHTADAYQGLINPTGLRDEELMALALDMRDTEPLALRTYVEKWLLFQEKFVALMPMISLYSNVYHDMFTDRLQGYDVAGNSGWSYAILSAYLLP